MNRLESVLEGSGFRTPDANMRMLLENLTPSTIVPQVSKYYVFVYKAKTPNIQYDRNPFIMCTSVHRWGFSGMNYHWGTARNYSWNEVVTNLYEIRGDEVDIMMNFPIANYKNS